MIMKILIMATMMAYHGVKPTSNGYPQDTLISTEAIIPVADSYA